MGPRSPDGVHPLRRGRRRRISIPEGVIRFSEKSMVIESDSTEEIKNEKAMGEDEVTNEKTQDEHVTSVLRTTTHEEQTTHTQSQSPLFQRLPPEIRALIWREAVGSYNIYLGIVEGQKRVRHCKIFEGRGLMSKTTSAWRSGSSVVDENQQEQNALMKRHYFGDLLVSCRRMYVTPPHKTPICVSQSILTCGLCSYTEAIPHLYTSNAFLASTPRTLLALAATTLTHRFTTLRTLTLKYTPTLQHGLSFGLTPHDLNLWHRTAHLLASMHGLRNLDIVFWDRSLYGSPGQWENLGELLEALKKVRQCRWYRVTLDQEGEVEELREKLGEVPFELRFVAPKESAEAFFCLS